MSLHCPVKISTPEHDERKKRVSPKKQMGEVPYQSYRSSIPIETGPPPMELFGSSSDQVHSFCQMQQSSSGANLAFKRTVSVNRYRPRLNLGENDEEFVVDIELPHFRSQDIKLEIRKGFEDLNELVVTGRDIPKECRIDRFSWHAREFEIGPFQIVVNLPSSIYLDKITSSLLRGVLCIKIPKKQVVMQQRVLTVEEKSGKDSQSPFLGQDESRKGKRPRESEDQALAGFKGDVSSKNQSSSSQSMPPQQPPQFYFRQPSEQQTSTGDQKPTGEMPKKATWQIPQVQEEEEEDEDDEEEDEETGKEKALSHDEGKAGLDSKNIGS